MMHFPKILRKPLVKETFVYTATDMIGKAMGFLLLPLVSFYLPPAELGIATNFTVLTSLVILLSGLTCVNSLPYFFYEQTHKENVSLISNLLIICIVSCVCLCMISLMFHEIIYKYLQLDAYVQLLSLLYVIGNLISNTHLILLRLENKSHKFAFLQITQIILHAVIVILFVIVLKGGGLGKIYAEVIVFVLMGIIHLMFIIKKGYFKLNIKILWIKKLFKFGLPLLPHSISFWLKSGIDKVFITTYCGLQFNGLYSMAISICSLYTMLTHSFFNAYTPYIQKKISKLGESDSMEEKKRIVKRTYQLYLLFFIVGVFTICGAWIIVNYIIDSKYLNAFEYVPLIIFANFIYTFYSFTIQFIYKKKKTLIMGGITFTGSLIQMFLSYSLIQTCGVMGAIYSLLIGNTLITLGIFFYSNKVYPMPWFYLKK